MSTASRTQSKLRETLKQEDAALAQRSRSARVPAAAAKPKPAAAPDVAALEAPPSAPPAVEVIAPVLPPPKPAAERTIARPAVRKLSSGPAASAAATVKAGPGVIEKAADKPLDKTTEAERKDRHEKVERDSFSMPASEHKRIKALREALGKDGVLVSKSEVLRAGLALLAEQDIAELARLIAALPKVAKGKRAKKH